MEIEINKDIEDLLILLWNITPMSKEEQDKMKRIADKLELKKLNETIKKDEDFIRKFL